MPIFSEIRATLCRYGGLIRLLTSALTASLQRGIELLHQAPGMRLRGVTSFLKAGDIPLTIISFEGELPAPTSRSFPWN
jgi:hypothetical protein